MPDNLDDFAGKIAKKAARKERARQTENRSVWYGLGTFGLVGWSVAVPTLIGVALGLWLDKHFHGRASWTVTLLFVGMVLGCLNAWYWIKQEGKHE